MNMSKHTVVLVSWDAPTGTAQITIDGGGNTQVLK
jgi:hypothetical protein